MSNTQLVWFKRDLRLHDNAALYEAALRGPVLPLYIIEPELWAEPDLSARQYAFLLDCLTELRSDLRKLGHVLVVRIGSATTILSELHAKTGFQTLWSHQETWNDWTYQRDKDVARFCNDNAIRWQEPRQFGVIRRMPTRTGWAGQWDKQMGTPQRPVPQALETVTAKSDDLPTAQTLNLADDACPHRQTGGRAAGLQELDSFLYARGEYYQKQMSSPVTAYDSCSRVSPYLSFGALSMKEVYQTAQKRVLELRQMPKTERGKWPGAMRAFVGRLHWHCHFIQKLEDEPDIEFQNMHRGYDGLRETEFDPALFEAWCQGRTGYPIIDASMRALHATGWLNFRMRAMLVSFASYHLWLHWREPSLFLARQFVDYEPGIHYCQHQMQSGVTGINSVRIYSPIKQSIDQDPEGVFIKRWIPELRDVNPEFLHRPDCLHDLAPAYPKPVVNEKAARTAAADKIYAIRKGDTHRGTADAVLNKHGSRKSGIDQSFRKRNGNGKGVITLRDAQQKEFPF